MVFTEADYLIWRGERAFSPQRCGEELKREKGEDL
jgi:hypothetical protein